MTSRRAFFKEAGLLSGAAVASPFVRTAYPLSPSSHKMAGQIYHDSSIKIIRKHVRKLNADPRHNIFSAGELLTTSRMYFEMLEATGVNAALSDFLRKSEEPALLKEEHLDSAFSTLAHLGIKLPRNARMSVKDRLIPLSAETAPKLKESLANYSIFKWERSVHAGIGKAQMVASGSIQYSSVFPGDMTGHLEKASFKPAKLNAFDRVYFEREADDPDDWWDSDYSDPFGGTYGGGGGDYGLGDEYSAGFYNWSMPVFHTPSGGNVSLCTIIYGLMGLLAALGGAIFTYSPEALAGLLGVSVEMAPAVAAALAVAAAGFAYYAIFC